MVMMEAHSFADGVYRLNPVGVVARYEALLRVSKALALHKSLADLIHALAAHLHSVVPFDYLAVVLHDPATDEMQLYVLEPADLPLPGVLRMPVAAGGPAAIVWQTQRATVIPLERDVPLVPALEYIRALGRTVTSWLPLTTAHGRLGVLSFGASDAIDYPPDAMAFMEQVASHVAVALDNALNFDQARRFERELRGERDRLDLLLQVNNLLVSELDHATLLRAVSDVLNRVVRHDYVSVAIYDEAQRGLRLRHTYDVKRGISSHDLVWPVDRSPAGVTFHRRLPSVFDRAEIEAFDPAGRQALGSDEMQRLCCLPLVSRHGVIGTLNVASSDRGAFAKDAIDLMLQMSVQIGIAVDNAIAYQAIEERRDHLLEENQYLEREIELEHKFDEIIGGGTALKRVLQEVETVAPTDATVLLLGETGTGKELIARAIHRLSPRHRRVFVRFSGAALPTSLFESELFGYEKGAFTSATTSRIGRLEVADGGTLFLDEVGDIPGEIQPKLLRVLQEREFERLGSTRTRRVDVRVIAATNRDLDAMVEEESFRRDLFYRLNVFPIRIPPLSARADDIPALARHFVARHARRMRRSAPSIPPPVLQALRDWHWPGNIRELENVIERAVILSRGPTLQLPDDLLQRRPRPQLMALPPAARPPTLEEIERESIIRALRESGGVVGGPAGAAARLGLKRTTLQSMMGKLGIRRPGY